MVSWYRRKSIAALRSQSAFFRGLSASVEKCATPQSVNLRHALQNPVSDRASAFLHTLCYIFQDDYKATHANQLRDPFSYLGLVYPTSQFGRTHVCIWLTSSLLCAIPCRWGRFLSKMSLTNFHRSSFFLARLFLDYQRSSWSLRERGIWVSCFIGG